MVWSLTWSPSSSADLDDIKEYHDVHAPGSTDAVILTIVSHVNRLRSMPFVGAIYRHRSNRPPIRETLAGNYRIFYRLIEAECRIEIVRIWHTSRGEPKSLN